MSCTLTGHAFCCMKSARSIVFCWAKNGYAIGRAHHCRTVNVHLERVCVSHTKVHCCSISCESFFFGLHN
ncbi:hypothetical protein DUNSADRAFT_3867 [Dunaliella salina]|uniref:Secreted protein n=1 Tax=Dunaliella salina TaxID=3046 RepID=A0ABQ7GT96_DUNSA|nr:hypothetical protein DUNSADRAFT_3867 [Dunaliella salina]|eukprot:KAF5837795.1 hypothetical protein DUNSADRAFT_3867 [Dunaliella salina]